MSLADLPAVIGKLDGVLIGGGHLIRFDKHVAPGYGPPSPLIHHPTGYWLTPALMAHQAGVPVVWNAPGVHGPVPEWAAPLMELAFGLSWYVAVRDEPSRDAIQPYALDVDVAVVPDTAFGIGSVLTAEQPTGEYERLRYALGIGQRYLIVQPTHGLEPMLRYLRRPGDPFRDYRLLVLPIGPALGDSAAVFGERLDGMVTLPDWPHPLTLARLISQADGVIGNSMHLAITAFACGVPVFRAAACSDGKYAVLASFDSVHAFDDSTAIDAQWFAVRMGREPPSRAAQAASDRLTQHWDRIAAVVSSRVRSRANQTAVNAFWQ